jgi:hypothetical protein
MGGKAILFLVVGFSLIFMIAGRNFNNMGIATTENLSKYYVQAQAHYIAASGVNLVVNRLFLDATLTDQTFNWNFDGGTISAALTTIDPVKKMKQLLSTGTYSGTTNTIKIILQPSNFAKFGNYYSQIVSAIPATGDVFDGSFHVNGNLQVYGSPVFNGKVTSAGSLRQVGPSGAPVFNGGYQSGVSLPMQFDTTGMRSRADKIFKGPSNKGISVQLYFNSDATVTYSTQVQGSSSWSSPVTTAITTIAPNGRIYVEGGNIYTKGTVNGNVTITATTKGYSSYGNIYQVDNLQYQNNPITNSSSTDMLGMIAEKNIRIQSNSQTNGKDIVTQASMYAMNGTIGPDDNLATHQSSLHDWKILGGLIAKDVRVTANYDYSGNPINGLRFRHTFDTRFLFTAPPGFPDTKSFEVISWFE